MNATARGRRVLSVAAASVLMLVAGAASAPAAHRGAPFSLYTHCGISGLSLGTVYYLADHPLDDGNGNPPDGWGNPYQPGWITTPTAGTAVFTDGAGHSASFHLTAGGAAGPYPCS